MKSPFAGWASLSRRIHRADLLALFLDFDGTLSRIVKRPELARMDRGVAKSLVRLSHRPKVRIAILSGRALSDLKTKVPLSGVYLAGCHGLEASGLGLDFVHPEAERRWHAVRDMAKALRKALSGIPGALVEEKDLSVAGHYRLVPRPMVPYVREKILRAAASQPGAWKVARGKQVIEILPETGWTKGSCVAMLLSLYRAEVPRAAAILPFYVGDDLPDQEGFDAVKGIGVSLAVGPEKRLRADYRLKDVDDVRSFLTRIEKTLQKLR